MKNPTRYVAIVAWSLLLLLAACGGKPKQSRCSVEVYYPAGEFSHVRLVDAGGKTIDSTLSIRNDSILFERTDSANMPYVAALVLTNPADSINMIFMPMVIEGGTVTLDLTDRVSLSGTADNEKMHQFLKAKNTFVLRYDKEMNPEHDVKKLKADYSKFYADQAILFADNIVGEYILQAYGSMMSHDDMKRVKERIKR